MPAFYFSSPPRVNDLVALLHLSGVFLYFDMPAFLMDANPTTHTHLPYGHLLLYIDAYKVIKILSLSIFQDVVLHTSSCHFCQMLFLFIF